MWERAKVRIKTRDSPCMHGVAGPEEGWEDNERETRANAPPTLTIKCNLALLPQDLECLRKSRSKCLKSLLCSFLARLCLRFVCVFVFPVQSVAFHHPHFDILADRTCAFCSCRGAARDLKATSGREPHCLGKEKGASGGGLDRKERSVAGPLHRSSQPTGTHRSRFHVPSPRRTQVLNLENRIPST